MNSKKKDIIIKENDLIVNEGKIIIDDEELANAIESEEFFIDGHESADGIKVTIGVEKT